MKTRYVKLLALLAALAVFAAACGSSSDDEGAEDAGTETEGNLIDEDTKAAAQDAIAGDDDEDGDAMDEDGDAMEEMALPTDLAGWEALWADERAKILADIEANGWGWDQEAGTVSGPDGFSMDLSTCPAGWDPYEGLEDGTILIGETVVQSGTLADYGNIAVGQRVLYDWVNAEGGITDSEGKTYEMVMTTRDDAYDIAKTVPLVDELLDSEKVFMLTTLGSPNTMKVYDKLNQRCVPQPFVMTGHPAWGDPENHPWTWGQQLAYNTEAILWGGLIEQRFADQDEIKVAALIMQNDFGKAYELGFQTYIAGSDANISFEFERIEPTTPTITNQMTTLAAGEPDVFIAMTAGTSCTQSITEAANNGMAESAELLFQPSVCKGLNFVGAEAVGGDGSSTDGWWLVGGGVKDFNDGKYSDDPWVSFARGLLEADGNPSENSSQLGNGFVFGWPVWQMMLIAAELPGGISRPNLVVAARSMDMTNPNLLEGIGYNMSGNADGYPIEGSEFATFDAAGQTWVTEASLGIIELSGQSANCVWDQSVSNCVE